MALVTGWTGFAGSTGFSDLFILPIMGILSQKLLSHLDASALIMRDLMLGGTAYGLFIFGRDPALMEKAWIKPGWMQSWSDLASDLNSAARRLASANMDVAIDVHRDEPPLERLATPEELQQ